jgi:hypothetical protein
MKAEIKLYAFLISASILRTSPHLPLTSPLGMDTLASGDGSRSSDSKKRSKQDREDASCKEHKSYKGVLYAIADG